MICTATNLNRTSSRTSGSDLKHLPSTMNININNITEYHSRRTMRSSQIKLVPVRKMRGLLSPAFISSLIISYIVIAVVSISFASVVGSEAASGSASFWFRPLTDGLIRPVSATSEPEPSASRSSVSVNSRSHRQPPLNGSIFGKRSVDTQRSRENQSRAPESKRDNSSKLNSLIRAKTDQNKQPSRNDKEIPNNSNTLKSPVKSVEHYEDLITDIIEDFLSRNTENDPEEASRSFCRMIVIECGRLLSNQKDSGFILRHSRSTARASLTQ